MLDENARARADESGYSTPGFAALYDTARPRTPEAVIAILQQMAGTDRPAWVVDVGCGTGLSTRAWAPHAAAVIGIEPNDAMRQRAESHPDNPPHLHYRAGFSHATGLADGCADIVTCSQALHWMEPAPTFAEVARILRPGGVFGAYEYNQLPTVNPAIDTALIRLFDRTKRIGVDEKAAEPAVQTVDPVKQRWKSSGHLERLQASGHFGYVKEVGLHQREIGSAERLMAYCRSLDGVNRQLVAGLAETVAALDELAIELEATIGSGTVTLYWSYRLWLASRQ
jgi:ubiquinone/menaquinone biosynthesis C-methylase UbiE